MSTLRAAEETLGNYRLGKNIGEGTFGKVRLGTHLLRQEKVAVKTLQKEKIVEQSDIERVTREICILKILRHPNIIQLYEIIETKSAIHLIMEYAEGGQLFDYIVKNKRINELQAVRFMQQILSGVQYIHKNGIVHRDLKPQNLLLDENKNIKIVDFGLSNQYKPGQRLKTACGSPCYAAPEMIAGKKYQCLNVDVWSCGIIIYAMLCGYLPFEDPNTSKLYKKIIAGEYQKPKILSSQARDILRNVLNVNPDTRYKIPQIRNSKWYNLFKNKQEQKGIIVGKDIIAPNETIIKKMQKLNFDAVQARTYIINNRHNHVTATYYLLQKKLQKQPKVEELEEIPKREQLESSQGREKIEMNKETNEQELKQQKRDSSPLIYRPAKKPDYFIPQKKEKKETKDSSKNDSINASNIIASLVEANKGKLLTERFHRKPVATGNFDKAENFKNFPSKLNSSIHDSSSGKKGNLTNRSSQPNDSSFESKRNSFTGDGRRIQGLNYSSELQGTEPNKKRQELSQQLKQISVKIDKEIVELKKQNEVNERVETDFVRRQAPGLNNTGMYTAPNRKRASESFNIVTPKESLNYSRETPINSVRTPIQAYPRERIASQGPPSHPQPVPKEHNGPYNAKCLFLQNPSILLRRVGEYLLSQGMRFSQQGHFLLRTIENHSVWIESISGAPGLNLVQFTKNFPKADHLLDTLTQS